jgi:hypothetical protein
VRKETRMGLSMPLRLSSVSGRGARRGEVGRLDLADLMEERELVGAVARRAAMVGAGSETSQLHCEWH